MSPIDSTPTDQTDAEQFDATTATHRDSLLRDDQFLENLHDVFATTVAETLALNDSTPPATEEDIEHVAGLLMEGVTTALDTPGNVRETRVVPRPADLPDDEDAAQRELSVAVERLDASLSGVTDALEGTHADLNHLQRRIDGATANSTDTYSFAVPEIVGEPDTDLDELAEEAHAVEHAIRGALNLSLSHGEVTPRNRAQREDES